MCSVFGIVGKKVDLPLFEKSRLMIIEDELFWIANLKWNLALSSSRLALNDLVKTV